MTTRLDHLDSGKSLRTRQRFRQGRASLILLLLWLLGGCAVNHPRTGVDDSTSGSSSPDPSVMAVQTHPQTAHSREPTQAKPTAPENFWQRLATGYALQHIRHPRIDAETARLTAVPSALHRLLQRGEPFFHHILQRVQAAGLPTELALLPAIESGFQPLAHSHPGAAGLWQIMPATGDMLGLEQDWWIDQRRGVLESTDAALSYLTGLNQRFEGDWLHALAGYNAGSGTVRRAIDAAEDQGRATDFWSLRLPQETTAYVPRLLALANIVADPDAYGVVLPEIPDQPHFAVVDTQGQIDLQVAARLAALPADALLHLNAGHKRWATHPDGPHRILLPTTHAEDFKRALNALPDDERMRWRRHQIRAGENLGRIARHYGVSVSAIQEANGLRDSRIRAGRDLLIPLIESPHAIGRIAIAQSPKTVRYKVRRGDSLYTIAKRFDVSLTDLQRWNQVGKFIQPGDQLTLHLNPDT